MIAMLSPDLLDRRALAWLQLTDVYGRTVDEPVRIRGAGIASVRKRNGTIAITAVEGFEAYSASFLTPSSPAAGSRHVPLDLQPASGEICARRFDLRLPRDPDPAKADKPTSIFQSVVIEMLPGPHSRLVGNACSVRVTVRRKSDKKLVENALVRARSEDEQFTARGVTDARGEATLIFPALPIAFPGAGANLRPEVQAQVVVTVDPAFARFNDPDALPAPLADNQPLTNPDELGSVDADFSSGAAVGIAAGRELGLAIEWTKP